MKNKILLGAGVLAALFSLAVSSIAVFAESNNRQVEVHINQNQHVLVRGAEVTSVGTTSVQAKVVWGSVVMNWTVNTDTKTQLLNFNGGTSNMLQIVAGHKIDFEGELDQAASTFTVTANYIRDRSTERVQMEHLGVVKAVDATAKSFQLKTEKQGTWTVLTTDATKFWKGRATTTFATLKVGDLVRIKGILENNSSTVRADEVRIYIEERRTFEGGKLISAASSTPPTSIVVKFSNRDYMVNIAADTSVLDKNWAKVSATSFKVGDHIRAYGVADGIMIDATVVRDMSL